MQLCHAVYVTEMVIMQVHALIVLDASISLVMIKIGVVNAVAAMVMMYIDTIL
jgi:hypothetical protein